MPAPAGWLHHSISGAGLIPQPRRSRRSSSRLATHVRYACGVAAGIVAVHLAKKLLRRLPIINVLVGPVVGACRRPRSCAAGPAVPRCAPLCPAAPPGPRRLQASCPPPWRVARWALPRCTPRIRGTRARRYARCVGLSKCAVRARWHEAAVTTWCRCRTCTAARRGAWAGPPGRSRAQAATRTRQPPSGDAHKHTRTRSRARMHARTHAGACSRSCWSSSARRSARPSSCCLCWRRTRAGWSARCRRCWSGSTSGRGSRCALARACDRRERARGGDE